MHRVPTSLLANVCERRRWSLAPRDFSHYGRRHTPGWLANIEFTMPAAKAQNPGMSEANNVGGGAPAMHFRSIPLPFATVSQFRNPHLPLQAPRVRTEVSNLDDQAIGTVAPLPAEAGSAVVEKSEAQQLPRILDPPFRHRRADARDGAGVDGDDRHQHRDADDHRRAARAGTLLLGRVDLPAGADGQHAAVRPAGRCAGAQERHPGRDRCCSASARVLAAYVARMTQLILFRGLQGLGAGGIMPVVLTILGDIFTLKSAPASRDSSAPSGAPSLAGPALGAFLVNTSAGGRSSSSTCRSACSALLVLMWKYHDREKPHSTDLDLPGIAALASACTGAAGAGLAAWARRLDLAGDGARCRARRRSLAIVFFVRHERRAPIRSCRRELLRRPRDRPVDDRQPALGVGFLSLDTYVPLYVQGGQRRRRHRGGAAWSRRSCSPGRSAASSPRRWSCDGASARRRCSGRALIVVGFTGLLHLRARRGAALGPHRRAGDHRVRASARRR